MNLSPLMSSYVIMTAPAAVQTYRDDIAIRQPITLLPSGYYGAVFSGIAFLNSTSNLKLNFTLSYPGGQQYDTDVATYMMSPPQPYARMGLGFYWYSPIFAGMQVRPRYIVVVNIVGIIASQSTFWPVQGNVPLGSSLLGSSIVQQLYQGYSDVVVWASSNSSLCSAVADPSRHAWCLESGFTIDTSAGAVPGTFLTPSFNVTGMCASDWHACYTHSS